MEEIQTPRTVLIVEDEALIRDIIADEFRDAGYEVIEAEDGATALAALETGRKIDLLFTDIRLIGGMDGWSIAQAARAARPQLPVMYASGYTAETMRMVEGGLFIKKPYRPSMVVATAAGLGPV